MLVKIRKGNGWKIIGSFDSIYRYDTPKNIESVEEQIRLFKTMDVLIEHQYRVRISQGHVVKCTFNEMLEKYGYYPINTVDITKYGSDKNHILYEKTIVFMGVAFIMNEDGKTVEYIPAVDFLTADPNELKEESKKAKVIYRN